MGAMSTTDETVYQQFAWVGQDLHRAQLVSSHGGNLSVRRGDRLIIKRSGALLGHLQPADLIETGLFEDDANTPHCSTELIVHRAIYRATPTQAIVHAHPRTAVALSLTRETIVPLDSEGGVLLGPVPVVAVEHPSGSPEVAQGVADALTKGPIVFVRRHGSFAIGDTLERAYQLTSVLEESCQIIWKTELLRAGRSR